MKLRLKFQLIVFISYVIFLENLNDTKHRNFDLILNFFQKAFLFLKKAYTMMICKDRIQSVICTYV